MQTNIDIIRDWMADTLTCPTGETDHKHSKFDVLLSILIDACDGDQDCPPVRELKELGDVLNNLARLNDNSR